MFASTLAAQSLGIGLPAPAQPAEPAEPKQDSFLDFVANQNAATAVNLFCQRRVGHAMSKDDITYTTAKLASGHQVTVRLDCIDGLEFAGEVCTMAKEAKLSAAQQVLDHFKDEMALMPFKEVSKKKKRSSSSAPSDVALVGLPPAPKIPRLGEASSSSSAGFAQPNSSNKGDLNTYYSKIIRRVIQKGEIVYQTNPVDGGRFQAQVQLPGLPAPWDKEVWAGEVHHRKADAEQSVAGIALQTLKGDPKLLAAFTAPPKPNNWLINGGMQRMREKGKGKGKDSRKGGRDQPASSEAAQHQLISQAIQNQTYAAAMAANGYAQYAAAASAGLNLNNFLS